MTTQLEDVYVLLEQIKTNLQDLISLQKISPGQISLSSLSDISKNLGLIQAGEFRSGNSIDPGRGFSGVRIGYPGFVYAAQEWNIAGVNNDTLQIGMRASDGKLLAANGDVVIDNGGINLLQTTNANTSRISFEYPTGIFSNMGITSWNGDLWIRNLAAGKYIRLRVYMTDGSSPSVSVSEDAANPNLLQMNISVADSGAKISLDNALVLQGRGTSSGTTRIRMRGASNTTPASPSDAQDEVNIYQKGNYLVLQFNDGGTIRYKYLDLTGTGVTWVHTTTAP